MPAARLIIATMLLCGALLNLASAGQLPPTLPSEIPKLDAYGDPLPFGAVARFGTTRLRHDAKAVAFLDNKTIISVGSSIRIWDAATARLIREHRHPKLAGLSEAAISADGKRAVTRNSMTGYCVWDIQSGQLIREFSAKSNLVNGMGFAFESSRSLVVSADGSSFATIDYENNLGIGQASLMVYSLNSKKSRLKLDAASGSGVADAMTPDGSQVISSMLQSTRNPDGNQVLAFWNSETGAQLRTDDPKIGNFNEIQILPGGKALAIAGEKATVCRTMEGKELWRRTTTAISSILAASSNRLLIGEVKPDLTEMEVLVLDAASGKVLNKWSPPENGIVAAAVSPDGERLVMAGATRIYVVNLVDGKPIIDAAGHSGGLWTTAVTPDGRFLAATDTVNRDVLLWDIASGKLARRFQGHTESGLVITTSSDSKLLAASSNDNSILVWDIATGRRVYKIADIDESIWAIRFFADNRRVAVARWSPGGGIAVYDCATGKLVHELPMTGQLTPSGLGRQADGRMFAIYANQELYQMNDLKNGGVDIWDVFGRRIVRHLDGFGSGNWVRAIWSRDLRTLATRGDGTIRLWEMSSGQQRAAIKDPQKSDSPSDWAPRFNFAPDGQTLAAIRVGKSGVDFWDLPTGKHFGSLLGHSSAVSTIDFTPDGRRLITGGEDSSVLCWDMTRPEWRSRPLRGTLTDEELARHWDRLRNASAEEAYHSKWAMAGDPRKTVEFLRTRFSSASPIPTERIKSWIGELDARQYSVRERAHRELSNHYEQAGEFLRQSLATPLSAEARSRINRIIDANFAAIPQPDQLRELRAVEILEQIATPEAREVLSTLATAKTPSRISRDAAESLRRLDQKPR